MQTLNQDIKSGEFKQIYLLYGEEAFLKNSYKNRLKEAIIGDDTMNFARFEGKGLDVDELIRLADTMPFFAEHRLILIEDCGFFKTASDALCSICHPCRIPPSSCSWKRKSISRNRLYKKDKGMASGGVKPPGQRPACQMGRRHSCKRAEKDYEPHHGPVFKHDR